MCVRQSRVHIQQMYREIEGVMCVRQSQVHIQQMYREIEGVHVCAAVTGTYTANVYGN